MNTEFDIDDLVFVARGVSEDTKEALVRKGKVTAIVRYTDPGDNQEFRLYSVEGACHLPTDAVFETHQEAVKFCIQHPLYCAH